MLDCYTVDDVVVMRKKMTRKHPRGGGGLVLSGPSVPK